MWAQVYDPLSDKAVSTALAALPVVVLLGALGAFKVRAHMAALLGLVSALLVAVAAFGMPLRLALISAAYGAAYGLFPIGWIVLNVLFLYQLTQQRGLFGVLRESITTVTRDRRLQLLLVAFCFGAFFEGASGFGTPVAVTGAILIGLGFSPLLASGLSLIANTAPVAFGALGTPIIALQSVTGLDLRQLSAMAGRQLPFFSLLLPFWLVWAFAGVRGMLGVWPAVLVAGLSFAVPQFLVSNLHGPWLVDVVASVVSMGALTLFLRYWQPRERWGLAGVEIASAEETASAHPRGEVVRAWMPWVILSVVVFVWGLPATKAGLDRVGLVKMAVPGLNNVVQRVPPVVARPSAEAAVFNLNWLSATGSGILAAALLAGFVMGFRPAELARAYGQTLMLVRHSLLTIAAMLA